MLDCATDKSSHLSSRLDGMKVRVLCHIMQITSIQEKVKFLFHLLLCCYVWRMSSENKTGGYDSEQK